MNFTQPSAKYPSADIGAQYFAAARRRLGIIMTSNSLVAVQCLFLAGIYYMYTMRQFAAWKMFNAASVSCQGYLHRKEKSHSMPSLIPGGSVVSIDVITSQDTQAIKRFEQRIYWSCLKSELELCKELDVAPSGLNNFEYPHAFPSPPREIASSAAFQSGSSSGTFYEQPRCPTIVSSTTTNPATVTSPSNTNPTTLDEDHRTRVASDELTWFYYLGEIAIRKVDARIATVFPDQIPPDRTIPLSQLVSTCQEFELQIDLWRNCLPSVLRFPDDPRQPCHDERIQYLRGRYWWTCSRIYRPFVYFLIHRNYQHEHNPHNPPAPIDASLLDSVAQLAKKGLELEAAAVLSNVITHRHHGTWLSLRATAVYAAVLLVSARNGLDMPSGWKEAIGIARSMMDYWEKEAKDAGVMRRCIDAIEGSLGFA